MPLVKAGLKADIKTCISNLNNTEADAATGISDAYKNYAMAGIFGPGTISSLDVSALQSALESAFTSQAGASAVAAAFASGVAAIWTPAVPLVVAGGTGLVVGCPGAAALTSLATDLGNTGNSPDDAAGAIADALDTATKTTTALITIPPAPPAPTPIS